jgi:hypothetical protein
MLKVRLFKTQRITHVCCKFKIWICIYIFMEPCTCCADTISLTKNVKVMPSIKRVRVGVRAIPKKPKKPKKDKMVPIVKGDLLDLSPRPGEYIVHQTNCKSVHAAGLATLLFKKYPAAHTYKASSAYVREPGTISIHGPIINLYGQNTPGKAKSKGIRQRRSSWFQDGLDAISLKIDNATVIYFPYGIGCGMAGGDWPEYLSMINNWAEHQDFKVLVIDPN